MNRKKLLALPVYFLLLLNMFFAQENKTPEANISSEQQKTIFNIIPRKIDKEFYLTSNFSAAFGFNFTNTANYPFLKLNIDIMEAWFDRLGVSSVLGFDIGFDPKNYSAIITQLICPGVNFSWDFGAGIYASVGLNLLHTWYYDTETTTLYKKTVSGGVLSETESQQTTFSTVRSYGASIPVKIRYAFSKNFTIYGEYIFAFHPWIPGEKQWVIENTLNAGLSFTLPVAF